MKVINLILILLLLIFNINCSNSYEKCDRLSNFNSSKSNPYFAIFIPIEGCGACIDKSLEFATRFQKSPDLLIVLVHHDKKKLQYIIHQKGLLKENVVFDTTGVSNQAKLSSVNTTIFNNNECSLKKVTPYTIDSEIQKIAKLLTEEKL